MKIIKFNGFTGLLQEAEYFNGRKALMLVDSFEFEPIATCTVNVPDEPIEEGEVFIKNYSENTGMTDTLVEAGVIEPPHRKFPSGFVQIEVCKLKK